MEKSYGPKCLIIEIIDRQSCRARGHGEKEKFTWLTFLIIEINGRSCRPTRYEKNGEILLAELF